MSIFNRGLASIGSARGERQRFGWLAPCGLLGLLAAGAWMVSVGSARAADSSTATSNAVEALIGDAVDTSSGNYKEVADAVKRFNYSDIDAARALLKTAKAEHKLLPPAELMLAKLLAAANQGQAARQELENCVKLHPEDPETYLIFGDQAFSERRFTDAALLFAQAKTSAATFTENKKRQRNFQIRAEAGLDLTAEAREQWDDAKAHLEAWLVIDPKSASAHDRLGRVLFKKDTSDDHADGAKAAYKEFNEAVSDDSQSISADIALAQLYEEAGKHDRATRFIALAVKQNLPAAPEAKLATLLAAAHWALESDQPTEAREYAEMALKAKPDSLEAKFLRGVAARLLKDTAVAESSLQEVYMASPMNFAASNQYAQVLAEQNNKDKRQKALEIAKINDKMFGGQNRQGIETAATLGWIYYQMGQINQADQVMQAIVKTGSPSADALYYRARILQDVGKTEEAVNYLKTALGISKAFVHHKEAKDMLAKLNSQLGNDTSDDTSKESKKSDADSSKADAPKADAGAGKSDLGPAAGK
jgi:tetratricopeptide (TPR) repeat protein